jgi:hypothetical protein
MLFAQAGGRAGQQPVDDTTILLVLGVVFFISLAIGLGIQILFLMTLQKALRECSPRNRTMEPGQVFLNLIPCFSLVWTFITVNRMTESLRHEFRDRGMRSQEDYGQGVGTTYAVLMVCSLIPYLGSLVAIGALVCWIIYWVKIAGLGRELREAPSYRDDDDRDYRRRHEDEEDARPRRKRDDRDDTEDRPDDDRDGGYRRRYD